jgi:hypothetical protein
MDTDYLINKQFCEEIENFCDMLIKHLKVDDFDLNQIQKRIFRLGYNNYDKVERQRSDVFKLIYEKFSEMKPNVKYEKSIFESDSSDCNCESSDSE